MNIKGLMSDNGYDYPTETQLRNIFASSCVETTARRMNISPSDMYQRMKRVELFRDLIYPCYETLHTQSHDVVTDDIIEALNVRERKNGKESKV